MDLSLELSDYGNATVGTKVKLGTSLKVTHQIWVVTERVCIESGHIYGLKNCMAGTVIDLSKTDNRTVTGWTPNSGPNQSWIFEGGGDQNTWFIKSFRTGKYLGIEGELYSAKDGTKVVADQSPFKWDVRDSDVQGALGIRIFAHGTKFSVELSDYGNAYDNTQIVLCSSWKSAHQIWALTERR
ncbi:hypothetical protein DEU56DRAFT_727632 [Suillus clintonianus]|uniref:uncharacterized protein n=1 Tax=Suillus clintonianus TaxID=1904413 RepID=UPI001B85E76E|nr:uncharacterized protein DEU56DRAFT_727632 [Suillus clintonianus]KAG2152716.1 hypothetical protein DEU56DRAFT_727632 [Suillus clintonianus]